MGFVNDDRVVVAELRIALCLGEQDAVGHQRYTCRRWCGRRSGSCNRLRVPTKRTIPRRCGADGQRSDAAGCVQPILARGCRSPASRHILGNCVVFARAGFARDDDDLIRADGGNDFVFARGDGEFGA